MSQRIEFSNQGFDKHTCQSWQEGDWLIFHCEECGFMRKLNWTNGKMVLVNWGDKMALHNGTHAPVKGGLDQLGSN